MSTRLSLAALTLLAGCYAASDRFIVFNAPPAVSLLLPVEGSTFEEDEGIVFQGRVSDNQPLDTLVIEWESSVDGPLASLDIPDPDGYLELATASLSPGSHVVTLRATDDDGLQGEARVTIHIDEAPEHPTIEVVQPQNNGQGLEGFPYQFIVRVDDHQTPSEQLIIESTYQLGTNGAVTELCLMVPDTTGQATCSKMLDNGTYLLSFTVTDLDGFYSSRNVVFSMVAEGDYDGDGDGFTPNGGDCNDDLATVYPGAQEICDGLDNDCITTTAIDVGTDCWDDDSDNFCEHPPCVNASGTLSDCDDGKPWVYPGAPEQLNSTDDDCDGLTDEGTSKWDDDGDGYCEAPPCLNASGTTSDCNDANNQVRPGMTESCATAYDDDCDGLTNEQNATACTWYYYDQDQDGYYSSGNSSNRQCWCDDQVPYTATSPNDCYDQNAAARPGQISYFQYHRGDGSFDYNCNGSPERQYPTTTTCYFEPFSCEETGQGGVGWNTTVPSCGNEGTFVDDCSFDYWSFIALCLGGSIGGCWDCWASGVNCGTCVGTVLSTCPGAMACDPDGPQQRIQACR